MITIFGFLTFIALFVALAMHSTLNVIAVLLTMLDIWLLYNIRKMNKEYE